jgi:hypothetical protein
MWEGYRNLMVIGKSSGRIMLVYFLDGLRDENRGVRRFKKGADMDRIWFIFWSDFIH